jgi:hypothetical protein
MKKMIIQLLVIAWVLALGAQGFAADEFTLYELQAPESHSFAITYDVTTTREGAQFFFNPIRPGSISTKERVIERSTGKELKFEVVDGKEARASGLAPADTPDKAEFIRVHLPRPVPKDGETRIRIFKTYTDPASYTVTDGRLVFTRPLSIKRNVVVLPKGWELIECASPGIISTDGDGRVRVSFLNDRDDQLPVKIVARRLP